MVMSRHHWIKRCNCKCKSRLTITLFIKETTENFLFRSVIIIWSLQMIFDLTAKKLISYEPDKSSENLRTNFVAFIQGLISFPMNIPGTAYHKCLQVDEPKPIILVCVIHIMHIFLSFFLNFWPLGNVDNQANQGPIFPLIDWIFSTSRNPVNGWYFSHGLNWFRLTTEADKPFN